MRKLPRNPNWKLDREQLAWAAGFIDGEGSFISRQRKGKNLTVAHPGLSVSQVDLAVLQKLQKVLGMGQISGAQNPRRVGKKPIYQYQLSSFEKVQAAIALLWTWLGPVKRAQAASVLQRHIQSVNLKRSVSHGC